MRILLLAHAFPPLATPQALRWRYLARELAGRGHDMHVLAPALVVDAADSIDAPPGVTVHRCSAGGLTAQIHEYRRRRRDARPPTAVEPPPGDDDDAANPGLNWKGRLHRHLDLGLGYFMYPDSTSQWLPPARAQLRRLLPALRPDVLIASHEPAGVLQLALEAGDGTPWIADLGDPVLAAYTPARWQRRAHALEARVCAEADHVVVTTEATRACLQRRHGIARERVSVITQGFDAPRRQRAAGAATTGARTLDLFYAGRFYDFRDPAALIEAVRAVPGVRLRIAAPELSADIRRLCQASPERIELLGRMPHDAARALQRGHDVLVNLGNRATEQTPGKLYEYFGACRPVLHLSSTRPDPAEDLIARHARGWSCANDAAVIPGILRDLLARKQAGTLDNGLDLGLSGVAAYEWRALAERIDGLLRRVVRQADFERSPAIA